MNLSEYKPRLYLLIELPYSKVIMNHPEAIELDKPAGAFIVPQEVWINVKAEFTINQMKQSGELTSSLAADGTEWLDCPNARPSGRAKVTTSHNGRIKSNQHLQVDAWNTMRDDGLKVASPK